MKVVAVNSSPRKESNTAQLINYVILFSKTHAQ